MADRIIRNYTRTINRKLPALMKKAGIKSKLALSEKLDITDSAVSQAWFEKTNWGIDVMVRMAELFDVTLDYLLLDKHNTQKDTDLQKELNRLLAENEKLKKQLETFTKMKKLMENQ